jgi:hypothetical protein
MTESAEKIKDAVLRLTGVAYTGPFVLVEEQLDQFLPLYYEGPLLRAVSRESEGYACLIMTG